jgi:hypothetical protein
MSEASKLAIQIIISKLIIPRMSELNISVYSLAKCTNISPQSLHRWLKMEQDITLSKFLKILTSLEINPEFVYKESDSKDYNYIHLN